jgi:lysophospholipase L1-like esterase
MKKILIIFIILFIPILLDASESTRLASLNGMEPMSEGIVMIGDSITEAGQWSELLNVKVRNSGFNGWTSKKIYNNLYKILNGNPTHIFIMVGVNDLRSGLFPYQIIENYKLILQYIKTNMPYTIIVIQSVLPIREQYNSIQPKINRLNFLLEELSINEGLKFLDISLYLKNSKGFLYKEYDYDSLHITGKAYEKWSYLIKEYLNNE